MCAQIKPMTIIVKSRGLGDGGNLQWKSYLLKINLHSHADCVNKVCFNSSHPTETLVWKAKAYSNSQETDGEKKEEI